MSEEKKSGAEKAIDRAEAKTRAKMMVAIEAWRKPRAAQLAIAGGGHDPLAEAVVVAAQALLEAHGAEGES